MKETVKFVKYRVFDQHSKQTWEEEIEIPYNEDIEKFLQDMIEQWNNEEVNRKEINSNYYPSIRKIINFDEPVMDESKKQKYCNLEKQNLVTIKSKQGLYDLLKCLDCGMEIKRFSLFTPNIQCYPERTCPEHQKVYNSSMEYYKHLKKSHHNLELSKIQITEEKDCE